jgi:hypothetical protein
MAAQGERIAGGFHLDSASAMPRQQAVAVIPDADECRDETLVQLHGGHIVLVPGLLDEVLPWPWTPLDRDPSDRPKRQSGLGIMNSRLRNRLLLPCGKGDMRAWSIPKPQPRRHGQAF